MSLQAFVKDVYIDEPPYESIYSGLDSDFSVVEDHIKFLEILTFEL